MSLYLVHVQNQFMTAGTDFHHHTEKDNQNWILSFLFLVVVVGCFLLFVLFLFLFISFFSPLKLTLAHNQARIKKKQGK